MNIFISANNTNQGKTYTTLKLIETFNNMGYKVGVMKPVETGVEDLPLDGKLLLEKAREFNPKMNYVTLHDVVPIRHKLPAAPYVSGDVDFELIKKSYN